MYGCFKHVHWIHLEFIPLTSVQRQHLGVFGTRGCGGCDEGLVCVYNAQTRQIKKLGFSTQPTLPEVVNHRMTESILHCVLCKPNFTPHQKATGYLGLRNLLEMSIRVSVTAHSTRTTGRQYRSHI